MFQPWARTLIYLISQMFNVYSIYIHLGILSGWNVDWNTPVHWVPGCHSQNWWWRNAATSYHWPNQRSSKAVKSWVVLSNVLYNHPYLGKMHPFWLIFFQKGLKRSTTNQKSQDGDPITVSFLTHRFLAFFAFVRFAWCHVCGALPRLA